MAARRPSPDHQLLRARRSGGHDADVHGLRAGACRRPASTKGRSVLQDEQNKGLALIRALDAEQQREGDPRSRTRPANNKLAEAFQRQPRARLRRHSRRRADATRSRSSCSTSSTSTSATWTTGHAQVKMDEVRRHLDDTYFAWIGGTDADARLLLPHPQSGDPDRVRSPDAGDRALPTIRACPTASTSTPSCARPTATTTARICCASTTRRTSRTRRTAIPVNRNRWRS